MVALLCALWLVTDEVGFGGGAASEAAPAPAEDTACVVQVDGKWLSCAEAVAKKQRTPRPELHGDTGADVDDAPPLTPEQVRAKALLDAAKQEAPRARPRSAVEAEIDKDPFADKRLPLLRYRIAIAELAEELERLAQGGYPPARRDPVERALADKRAILDMLDRIALARMNRCVVKKGGAPFQFKTVRMTAGGPIPLSTEEILAQAPVADPAGCVRIWLVDDEVTARVERRFALAAQLKTTDYGYFRAAERQALEDELRRLDESLRGEALVSTGPPVVVGPATLVPLEAAPVPELQRLQ